ncbi:MAG: amidase family protein, partial [Burkholderiaceae bacterium]
MNALSIAEARRRIAADATHRSVIDEVLERATSGDAAHVFIALGAGGARAAADAADVAARSDSPVAGLPITVKDLFDVAGEVTRAGSRVLDDVPAATRDAVVVERLRKAGAAIIGRTNMT